MKNIFIVLLHHPVERNGRTITSSIKNIDLHDIARISATYDLGGFFVVQPDKSQQKIAKTLLSHWTKGAGKEYNSDRAEAFNKLKIYDSLEQIKNEFLEKFKEEPILVATTAKKIANSKPLDFLKKKRKNKILLLFGTAGGISLDLLNKVDVVLEPLGGDFAYNHLSVRTAVAIFIDRLHTLDIIQA